MRRARTICRWQIVSAECPPPLRRAGRRAPPGLVARARRPFQRRRADRRLRPRLRHGHHLRRHPPDRAEIAAAATGLTGVPVVVGGIIPDEDAARLRALGVARIYTPKDFELNRIMFDIVALVEPKAVAAE